MALGFACSTTAQNVIFTIVKTDGTSIDFPMDDGTKVFYDDTQLYVCTPVLGIYPYEYSSIRKAYFSTIDNNKNIDNKQFAIYPNPANDVLRILNLTDNQLVTIYSINGAVMKQLVASDDAAIDISDLRAGIYIIGIGNEFSKFIKM